MGRGDEPDHLDRKSTRLNSSHLVISYAVFCLKKKTSTPARPPAPAHPLPRAPHSAGDSTAGRAVSAARYAIYESIVASILRSFFFFFNDTATTEIYTLSLHDALPISCVGVVSQGVLCATRKDR